MSDVIAWLLCVTLLLICVVALYVLLVELSAGRDGVMYSVFFSMTYGISIYLLAG